MSPQPPQPLSQTQFSKTPSGSTIPSVSKTTNRIQKKPQRGRRNPPTKEPYIICIPETEWPGAFRFPPDQLENWKHNKGRNNRSLWERGEEDLQYMTFYNRATDNTVLLSRGGWSNLDGSLDRSVPKPVKGKVVRRITYEEYRQRQLMAKNKTSNTTSSTPNATNTAANTANSTSSAEHTASTTTIAANTVSSTTSAGNTASTTSIAVNTPGTAIVPATAPTTISAVAASSAITASATSVITPAKPATVVSQTNGSTKELAKPLAKKPVLSRPEKRSLEATDFDRPVAGNAYNNSRSSAPPSKKIRTDPTLAKPTQKPGPAPRPTAKSKDQADPVVGLSKETKPQTSQKMSSPPSLPPLLSPTLPSPVEGQFLEWLEDKLDEEKAIQDEVGPNKDNTLWTSWSNSSPILASSVSSKSNSRSVSQSTASSKLSASRSVIDSQPKAIDVKSRSTSLSEASGKLSAGQSVGGDPSKNVDVDSRRSSRSDASGKRSASSDLSGERPKGVAVKYMKKDGVAKSRESTPTITRGGVKVALPPTGFFDQFKPKSDKGLDKKKDQKSEKKTVNKEATAPNKVAVLKFGKSARARARQLLALPPQPVKASVATVKKPQEANKGTDVGAEKLGRSNKGATSAKAQEARAKDPRAKEKEEKVRAEKEERARQQKAAAKPSTTEAAKASKPSAKRPRPSEEEEAVGPATKRTKAPTTLMKPEQKAARRPTTPQDSPLPSKSNSAQKSALNTPRKSAMSTAMTHSRSNEGQVNTPLGNGSNDVSTPSSLRPSSQNADTNGQAQLDLKAEWKAEWMKYRTLAKTIKHEAQTSRDGSEVLTKQGALLAVESLIGFMIAFAANNELIRGASPFHCYKDWESILTFAQWVRNETSSFGHLSGLACQLAATCRERYGFYLQKYIQREVGSDNFWATAAASRELLTSLCRAEAENKALMQNLWVEGAEKLAVDIVTSYPETWDKAVNDPIKKVQVKPGEYTGPFFLPLSGSWSSHWEAIRFGIAFLPEWAQEQKVEFKGRL